MNTLISIYTLLGSRLARLDRHIPTLARLIFAAVLLQYFWASALTKLGTGPFTPSLGAYAQIFPKAMESVGYDVSQLSIFHWAVVLLGTWAEFVLPLLVTLGVLTRLSSLGMIGFVAVQSLTDLYGHGGAQHIETVGKWFDSAPDSVILDQRALWVFLLVTLVIKGGGLLSIDRLLLKNEL